MSEIPAALTVLLAVGTAAAAGMAPVLARTRGQLRGLRLRATTAETDLDNATRHNTDLSTRLQVTEEEIRHLAGARLPDLTTSLAHPHVPVRGPLDNRVAGTDLDKTITGMLEQVTEALDKERLRIDSAAQAALRGASTTIQALLYQLQTLLQEMQERHDDPELAQDLLAADFLNEQTLRRIQATAVVCGAWPGLTREDSHLADIVVGATSRLQGYERLQVTSQLRDPMGVVARAVEPVAIALTELMANALHYSHPELPVAVTLQQGNRGASVIIDDAGVGMHEDELHRAMRLMAGRDPILITELGDPIRSGFAAIGQLVRQYGFNVHVEASPYGGVRAIVHIPGESLLTVLDEQEQPLSAMAPIPAAATAAGRAPALTPAAGPTVSPAVNPAADPAPRPVAAPPSKPATPVTGPTTGPADGTGDRPSAGTGELPRRRRRQPVGEARSEPETKPAPDPVAATPEDGAPEDGAAAATGRASEEEAARIADRWAEFQEGTASGRSAAPDDTPTAQAPTAQAPTAQAPIGDGSTGEAPAADEPAADDVSTAEAPTPDDRPARHGAPAADDPPTASLPPAADAVPGPRTGSGHETDPEGNAPA